MIRELINSNPLLPRDILTNQELGLNQKLEQKETELTEFKARLARLEELIKLNGDRK
jgi:hypothetical protein